MSKRKKKIIIATVSVVLLLSVIFTVFYYYPRYPFKDLKEDSIKSVTVPSLSFKYTFVLTDEETAKLVTILHKQKVHGFTIEKYWPVAGASDGPFTITYNDGSIDEVETGGKGGLVINSTGYHADYDAYHELFYFYYEVLEANGNLK